MFSENIFSGSAISGDKPLYFQLKGTWLYYRASDPP